MSNTNTKKVVLIILIIVGILGFIVLGVAGVFLFLQFYSFGEPEPEPTANVYQYSEYDSTSNVASKGLVTMTETIMGSGDNAYMTYRKEGGRFVVISNFADETYHCSGTCKCRTSDSRRSGAVLTKGVFLMISAVSSVMAVNIAQDYFKDECERILENSGQCETSDYVADVGKCLIPEKAVEEEEYTKNEDGVRLYGERFEEWLCKGHCIPHKEAEMTVEKWRGMKFLRDWLIGKFNRRVVKLCLEQRHEGVIESKAGALYTAESVHERFRDAILKNFCWQMCQRFVHPVLNRFRERLGNFQDDFCTPGEKGEKNIVCTTMKSESTWQHPDAKKFD